MYFILNLRFQLIELWETFLMQLDADEDGEPFFKPPVVAPAPLQPSDEQPESEEQHRVQQSNTSEPREESESEAAAIPTAEQEEE